MTFYRHKRKRRHSPQNIGETFRCRHGSWNRTLRTGYKVCARISTTASRTGNTRIFNRLCGGRRSVWGRPVGVAVAHDGALLVTEDGNGTLWRIAYTGH